MALGFEHGVWAFQNRLGKICRAIICSLAYETIVQAIQTAVVKNLPTALLELLHMK
jgi:hypothetical protein